MEWIELDRGFVEVHGVDESMIDAPAYLALWAGKVNWDELLALPRVVVLGEARTGKTEEFRERARLLASTGGAAFFLTVEGLARGPLEHAFGAEEQERFERWYAGGERGYFFVDSVDEAQLHGLTLEAGLKCLERGIRRHVERANVLVSCRVSDWHREDAVTFRRAIPPPGDTDVRVFSIAPLDLDQIEKLANHAGVADARAFRRAAESANADMFLARPGDLEWMAEHWRKHGRFGTLTELLEEDIAEKLIERNARRATAQTAAVDPALARRAVETLAGLAWLERKSSFAVPDGELDPRRAAACVDAAKALCDMAPQAVKALLALAIFDEATYGRVRLHHRSVTEYLIACWLDRLMTRGLPAAEVESLLFRDGPGGMVVPQRWRPIAAWLGCMEESGGIRPRLIAAAPSAFLLAGDPTRLTPRDRNDILDSLVRLYVDRDRRQESVERAALRRFATCCEPATIAAHLGAASSGELRSLLVEIVQEGRMTACVSDVLRIATSDGEGWSRRSAIRCVAEIGAPHEIEQMLEALVDRAATVEQGIGGELVSACYPRTMSLERMVVLVSRAEAADPRGSSPLRQVLETEVLPRTRAEDREQVLDAILRLVTVPGRPRGVRTPWLLGPFVEMICYQADNLSPAQLVRLESYLAFFADLSEYQHLPRDLDGENELRELLRRNSHVRRLAFWWDVRRARHASAAKITRMVDLYSVGHLWDLLPEDATWLAEQARSQVDETDRRLAFDCLRHLPVGDAESQLRDQLVRAVVASDEVLRAGYEDSQRPVEVSSDMAALIATMEQQQRHFAEQRAQRRTESRLILDAGLDGIRDGTDTGLLTRLFFYGDTFDDDLRKKLDKVTAEFGDAVASAMKSGLRRMWRTTPCMLRHESEVPPVQDAARAGLTLDIEDGLDFSTLDDAAADLAARHAASSWNQFPSWAERLLLEKPGPTGAVLRECVQAEYAMPTGEAHFDGVLYHLVYGAAPLRRAVRPTVVAALVSGEPPRAQMLRHALRVLIESEDPLDDIATLAPSRYEAARGDRERRQDWWCAWLAADPAAATTALEADILALSESGAKEALMVEMLDHVSDFLDAVRARAALDRSEKDKEETLDSFSHDHGAVRPRDPAVLSRLVEIAFTWIPKVERYGAGTVGTHDNADTIRYRWLEMLANTPGAETQRELGRLAALPALADLRDDLLMRRDQRLSDDLGAQDPPCVGRILATYVAHGMSADRHAHEMDPSRSTRSRSGRQRTTCSSCILRRTTSLQTPYTTHCRPFACSWIDERSRQVPVGTRSSRRPSVRRS